MSSVSSCFDAIKATNGLISSSSERELSDIVHTYIREIRLRRFQPETYKIDNKLKAFLALKGFKFRIPDYGITIDIDFCDGSHGQYVYFHRCKQDLFQYWHVYDDNKLGLYPVNKIDRYSSDVCRIDMTPSELQKRVELKIYSRQFKLQKQG